jgi:hypothetical protein
VSAEVNIPDEAAEAFRRVKFNFGYAPVGSDIDALKAAAPLIVAAELDRLADDLTLTQQDMREEDNRTIRSSGLGTGIARLRDRAAELRGESR